MAVFVAGALPDQTVNCRIVKEAKNCLTGQLLEITSSGFEPEPSICPHGQCGGCPLALLPYSSQMFWKEKLVRDALQRIGKIPAVVIENAWQAVSPAAALRHFRNKITLAFGRNEHGQFCLGMRQRESHLVTGTPHCALVPPEAMAVAKLIAEEAAQAVAHGKMKEEFWRFLTLRQSANDKGQLHWRAILITRPADRRSRRPVEKMAEQLLAGLPQVEAVIWQIRRKDDLLAKGEKTVLALGNDPQVISLPLGGRLFQLTADSFFQVNLEGAEALAGAALRMDAEASGPLLDIYCGAGAPGQLLAARHGAAHGLELDAEAIKWAAVNAEAAGLHQWSYASGDAGRLLKQMARKPGGFGTVLLDPPRNGAGPAVMEQLKAIGPECIIYISCNAATLARDALHLSGKYELTGLEFIDMFPHTPHGEICSLWRRTGA